MLTYKGKTYSEKKWNEDTYYASDTCIFVIDGATGLSNNQIMSEDDAHWFATRLKEEMIKRIHQDSLKDSLKESILVLQKEYRLDVSSMLSQDMPSGCISIFREKDNFIEYMGVGDCVGILECKDGSAYTMFDERIEQMDGAVIQKMIALSHELNIPFLETRPYVNPILLENRNKRNKAFYALDLTTDFMDGIVYSKWNKEEVSRIACLSDGLYQLMDFYPKWKEKDLLDALENDMDQAFKNLYNKQELDFNCLQHPRLKKRDDTTGVYAKIQED